MSQVFVVGAPSGTGKTTLLKLLLERTERLRFAISHTTRPARPGELPGQDYHFVDRPVFQNLAAAGEFLEWAEVYGNLYGTHRAEIESARRDGVDLILDVDVQGARAVRRALPRAVLILILPPSWQALEERLRSRGTESESGIARRLSLSHAQLEGYECYDYALINDDMEQAYRALESIVLAARHSVKAQEARLIALIEKGTT